MPAFRLTRDDSPYTRVPQPYRMSQPSRMEDLRDDWYRAVQCRTFAVLEVYGVELALFDSTCSSTMFCCSCCLACRHLSRAMSHKSIRGHIGPISRGWTHDPKRWRCFPASSVHPPYCRAHQGTAPAMASQAGSCSVVLLLLVGVVPSPLQICSSVERRAREAWSSARRDEFMVANSICVLLPHAITRDVIERRFRSKCRIKLDISHARDQTCLCARLDVGCDEMDALMGL